MVLISEFSFPSDGFALPETLHRFPDVVVEGDHIVAHSPNATLPCLWASGGDLEAFSEAVAEDPTVEKIQATSVFDEEILLHLVWIQEIKDFVAEIVDHEGTMLEASASDDRWRLRLRFMTRDQFDAFRDHYSEKPTPFRLEHLHETDAPRQETGDVTPEQHEALVTATEAGYFDVPRSVSIQALADEMEVSHQAVSERLRRGTANLVGETLLHERADDS